MNQLKKQTAFNKMKTILLLEKISSPTQFKAFSGEQVESRSETAATDGAVL